MKPMKRDAEYFVYEEKEAIRHLRRLNKNQTFRMGLELSDLALKMSFKSFEDQYKNLPRKIVLEKFRSFVRNN
jgi:hypothetical protein